MPTVPTLYPLTYARPAPKATFKCVVFDDIPSVLRVKLFTI